MPKSNLESLIEKATNENNLTEDWGLYFEIIDEINQTNSEKEAIKIFTRRLNDRDPHVIAHTLPLLNACVGNCSKNFKLELCSRTFIDVLKNFVISTHPKLSEKMASMIESWYNEPDFKNDPALNLLPTLYIELKKSGVNFVSSDPKSQKMKSTISKEELKREEEDLARAIQLSLKEANQKSQQSAGSSTSNSLYGSLLSNSKSNSSSKLNGNDKRKVKAMYDFEAAEDNEITFKAGDILHIIDDSDQNWWKGTDNKGNEGLFPSNFVTSDLSYEVESFEASNSSKKVSFNDQVNVKLVESNGHQPVVQNFIDEKKIDDCIELLQNADPTGEIQPDSRELLELEDQCYMMGPLIDRQLQKIDHKHAVLEDLNFKLLEAFQIYNNLMKESISKTNTLMGPLPNINVYSGINLAATNIPNINGSNSIQYAAAPPSFDQNSLMLANQLNNMTTTSSNIIAGMPNANLSQIAPNQTIISNYLNQQQMVSSQSAQQYFPLADSNQMINSLPSVASSNQIYSNGLPPSSQTQMPSMISMSNPNFTN